MNSSDSNKQNLQWDVDRYLLSDPSFDRESFEQRMLEDVELAELVAASVANLQAISSAAKLCDRGKQGSLSTVKSQRRIYQPMLVTAALVLLTFSVWQLRSASNEEQLSQIADNWVSFEGLSTSEVIELIATDDQSTEIQNDAEMSEQSDWLVEAAREFYLANNEGAAG